MPGEGCSAAGQHNQNGTLFAMGSRSPPSAEDVFAVLP
jgi:hypothetical protein